MLSDAELRLLPAKEVKEVCDIPLNAVFVGTLQKSYCVEIFYRLTNGSFIFRRSYFEDFN